MSLLFNMLPRLVITFLPRSKHLLISCLQSPSAVILEPKKIKSVTVSPSICHEVMGPDAKILVFWMLNFKPTVFILLFHFHQETFKSLLQHHNLQPLAFCMVQLSHPYMTTGKTVALTTVGKVMSLLFNMLSGFVIAFLPRRKHLLISCLQSPSAVVLKHKKIKSVTVSIVFPSIFHEMMGPDALIFVFWMLSFKPAFSLYSFTLMKRN